MAINTEHYNLKVTYNAPSSTQTFSGLYPLATVDDLHTFGQAIEGAKNEYYSKLVRTEITELIEVI